MQPNIADLAIRVMVLFVPFLFALCFHEFAHGWVARKRGDNTALMMGRLTMNPLVHMDMVGTVILPLIAILNPGFGFFFGWAKPVPVNERNLKNPRADMFWIALAGPASNFLLAIMSAVILFVLSRTMMTEAFYIPAVRFFQTFISINLMLAIFNALPFHPLDGGKIIARFLPASVNYKLEQNEHITGLLLLPLFFLFGKYLMIPVGFFEHLLMAWI
jgi:Zn-dependent protease